MELASLTLVGGNLVMTKFARISTINMYNFTLILLTASYGGRLNVLEVNVSTAFVLQGGKLEGNGVVTLLAGSVSNVYT